MNIFSELEFEIMDELYFLSSFRQLMTNTGADSNELKVAILHLLQQNYIQQYVFNESLQDFDKLEFYDKSKLESASYVATRKGLLAHNMNG